MHNLVLDTEYSDAHHGGMELAALAYLADHLPDETAWIPRAVLNGRQPTQDGIQALHDRLTEVVELDDQLGA